jgi:hypothetical protein
MIQFRAPVAKKQEKENEKKETDDLVLSVVVDNDSKI